MSGINHWSHVEELSVVQAALLMSGVDPTGIQEAILRGGTRPDGFDAAFQAVTSAVLSKRLRANERHSACAAAYATKPRSDQGVWVVGYGGGQVYEVHKMPDWHLTTVRSDDLTAWLEKSRVYPEFFFPTGPAGEPNCMNKKHPHYAPKLAAAFSVWMHFAKHPDGIGARSAKAAMDDWISKRVEEFDLINPDGTVNQHGIEEVCKVANWKPGGGVPKSNQAIRKVKEKSKSHPRVHRKS